jgi:hypothetical protein
VQWISEMLPDARRDRGTALATAATARQAPALEPVDQVEPEAPPKAA